MKVHGFSPYGYEPLSRRIIAAVTGQGNTVFVRDVAAVEHRAREAPRFRLVNGDI